MERALGYAIEEENMEVLYEQGKNTELMLKLFADQYPTQNPYADPLPVTPVKDQDGVGACQGFSLSNVLMICYYLKTGRLINLSAMCCYILSQREDRLIGRDVGSTLSGGMRAAAKGVCEDAEWPFRDRYDPTIPNVNLPFKFTGSKPTNDPELIDAAIDAGLPVQTGMSWNKELEQEIVTSYTGRGASGGHATYLFGRKEGSGNIIHHNSWGRWNQDGKSEWTRQAMKQIVTFRQNTFVIYSPELQYPPPPIVNP